MTGKSAIAASSRTPPTRRVVSERVDEKGPMPGEAQ